MRLVWNEKVIVPYARVFGILGRKKKGNVLNGHWFFGYTHWVPLEAILKDKK